MTSFWAWSATASSAWMVPPKTMPGGKPVTALPGLTPRSPVTMVGPVLFTVEPARTAKLAAVPSEGAVANKGLALALVTTVNKSAAMSNKVVINVSFGIALVPVCHPFRRPTSKWVACWTVCVCV